MATIGTFKKSGNEFSGEIVTLSSRPRTSASSPRPTAANDNAPSHRVFVGRAEIGAAWSKRSNEGRDYLGLKLDDPSFTAPIFANLFDDEDGESLQPHLVPQPQGQRRLSRSSDAPPGTPGGALVHTGRPVTTTNKILSRPNHHLSRYPLREAGPAPLAILRSTPVHSSTIVIKMVKPRGKG